MTYDLGSVVPLAVATTDSTGTAANVGSMALTITLPDGTTAAVSPSNPATGSYTYDYTPTQTGRHAVRWVATGQNASSYPDVFDVRDPADLPVVGLAEVKAHLNITVTTYDAELRRFADAATDLCEGEVGGPLRRRTFTETYDGGTHAVILRQSPVISVTSVTDDGVAHTGYSLAADAGVLWYDDTGAGTWSSGRQTVSVTYVAGYASPPADVVQAVLEATRHLWTTQRGAMSARNPLNGDDYMSASGWALPNRVARLLWPYKKVGTA